MAEGGWGVAEGDGGWLRGDVVDGKKKSVLLL